MIKKSIHIKNVLLQKVVQSSYEGTMEMVKAFKVFFAAFSTEANTRPVIKVPAHAPAQPKD